MNNKFSIAASAILLFAACTKRTDDALIATPPNEIAVQSTIAGTTDNSSNGIYRWDFDGADPLHHLRIEDESNPRVGISVVPDPLNPNNKVMRAFLPIGRDRSEVALFSDPAALGSIMYFYADAPVGFKDKNRTMPDAHSFGNEVWVSMRVYRPLADRQFEHKPCIFQFGPVSNTQTYPSVGSGGFCQVTMRNDAAGEAKDTWNWRLYAAQGNVYTPTHLDRSFGFVKPDYGNWENFVLHCKYSTGADGQIQLWKDGVKYFDITCANALQAYNRIRIKWGMYIGIGNQITAKNVNCYFDDVRVVIGASSYEAMRNKDAVVPVNQTAYTNQTEPQVSNPNAIKLPVKTYVARNRISYLKFNLTNINYAPFNARLVLPVNSNQITGNIFVRKCTPAITDWNSSNTTVTWNTPISYDTNNTIGSAGIVSGQTTPLVIDLTSFIRQQISNNQKIFTLALTASDANAYCYINNQGTTVPALYIVN